MDRRLEDARRRLDATQRALAAIERVADAAASSREPQDFLRALLDSVVSALDLTCGAIFAFDDSRARSRLLAVCPGPRRAELPDPDQASTQLGVSLADQVAALGAPLPARVGGRSPVSPSTTLAAYGARSVLAVPLRRRDNVVGAVELGTDLPRYFSRAEVKLVEVMADRAAAAIECAALQQRLHDKESEVRSLAKLAVDAQEAERERICLEIHDGVAQSLAAAFQYQQLLEYRAERREPGDRALLENVGELIQRAIGETREMIGTLRPESPGTAGLAATLRSDLETLRAQTGWQVQFEADSVDLPSPVERALYRIAREAINNARKHSRTSRLDVRLGVADGRLTLKVRDYGVGFDPARLRPEGRGSQIGLLSMRRRAELLRGRCEVQSWPGGGTTVTVEIPLADQEDVGELASIASAATGSPTRALVSRHAS